MKNLSRILITTVSTILISSSTLNSCNKQIIDLNYNFNKAIIKDIGTVNIKSWNDYDQSDMIQVTTTDDKVYLTHSSNVILVKE